MKHLLLMVLLLNSSIGLADDVIHLNKDDKAPFTGFLFTEEKTRETRIRLIDGDLAEVLNKSYAKENAYLRQNSDYKDTQIKLVTDRNIELSKTVIDQQSTSTVTKVLYFVGGMVVTYVAIKTAHEIYK